MTDSPISALCPATVPLSATDMVPCVQGTVNKRAPASAFGIPVADTVPPLAPVQYQLWIDLGAATPTLNICIDSHWRPLYALDSNGAMSFSSPVGLAAGDALGSAMIFKGVIDCSLDPNYPPGDLGDFYVVSAGGRIGGASGVNVETGDTLLCMIDGTATGDQAASGANWSAGQGNINGAVTGPASAASGNFAQFSGTAGKAVADSGLSFDTDGTLASDSDARIASQKAVKTYIDTVAQGLVVKPSVKAASTASLTHTGTQTIDGVSCIAGDRVLDKNNASAALNGIWVVASGAWTRATDMDAWSEVPGSFCYVEQGTINGKTGWTCTAAPGGTLETTAIPWTQFSGAGIYSAGAGLSLSGTQFSAAMGSAGGSEAWSAELDAVAALSTTGIVTRTAAHTYTPRSLTAPAAGFTIAYSDGVAANPTFVLANDLAALEALSATGIAVRTGTDAWTHRALAQPAAGLAISNADGASGNPTFGLANDLLALEALSANGIAVRTGTDSWAQRALTAPAEGLTVSNADGSAGNPTFALANDLAALEALNTTGIAVRTGTDTWAQRAIAGAGNEIVVTNGDGVGGAPTIGLDSALTFTGKTVTGGTFTAPEAITGLPDPTNAQDAATKNYVDTAAQGLHVKPSVKAASTASLTHSGAQTIDGVSCIAGDRVLDKDNASPALNGIWVVASGAWTRATDMDAWSEIPGAFCFVGQGTVNGKTGWACTADAGGTLGTTAIVWTQFASAGAYGAGSGLSLSGTQFSAVIGSAGGSEAWSAELDGVAALSTTGIVARTAAHTYAPRSMTAPSSGLTISNPGGVSGNPTFALANDLAALEALSANGIAVRTGADSWAQRALTPPEAGLTVSNADGSAGNPTFALANDLAALEGMTSTGIAVRTGTDSWAQRTLTPPAAGLTVSNADGSAGNPTFALANDLAALEALNTTGIAVRTGTDTWTPRAIAGTAGEIAVSNGDGVSGAPTIGLAGALTFSGKIVTGGTFATPDAITGLPDPANAQDAANKRYVDAAVQGLEPKPNVKAASTASLSHTGTQTVDGVACLVGDRVLDKDNANPALRGIWVVASGSWTRAADMDAWSEIPGAFCFVQQGTVNGDTGWICTAVSGGTLETTAITWSQFAGPGTFTAGSGLSLSGTQFSAVIGSSGGSEAWSAELDGVSALSTAGLVARTAAHTYTPRSMTAPGAGLMISNPDGVSGNPTFALANDLAALEALSANGIAVRTGTDAWAQRTLTQPGAGLAISNPDGVSGNPTFALANDLAALEGLASTGIPVRTGTDAWTQRTLSAPSSGLTITNPDGVSGNPIFALADDLAALETLSGTNTIYYRSATSIWSAVTIGGMLSFGSGTLNAAPLTDPTLGGGSPSDTAISSQKAVKAYVDQIVSAQDAMVFKGSTDCSANPNYPAGNRGDTYRVSVAGKIGGASGVNVEAGDLYICLTDGTAAGAQATVGASWTIAQANLDGAVIGPTSAVSGHLATYNGTTGKLIQDSGIAITTDTTFVSPTDALVPTQRATQLWVSGNYQPLDSDLTAIAALSGTNAIYYRSAASTWTPVTVGAMLSFASGILNAAPSTDTTLGGSTPSDTALSSQKAVKAYVDQIVSAQDAMVFKGSTDCSGNPNYPAGNRGDTYRVSVAGKIGGASGVNVEAGDLYICLTDGTVTGSQAAVGASWTVAQANLDGAVIGPASAVSGRFATYNGTTGKLIQDSGLALATDTALGGGSTSDAIIPSQKAVRSYANANISGLPISTDTLAQGQAWLWDGQSSTFKACDVAGQNLLVNSAFEVWQENSSYTFGGSATKVHIADFWKVGASATPSFTVGKVGGGSTSSIKFQRTFGQTSTAKVRLAQQFSTQESLYLTGKTVTVSFDFTTGANYSPIAGPLVGLFTGAGTEEDIDIHGSTVGFPSTPDNSAFPSLLSQVGAAGTTVRLVSPPLVVPSGTEVALVFSTGSFGSTAAGSDDSFTIGNVKLEIGNIATPYRKPDYADELRRCQRRYQKSFYWGQSPQQLAGTSTGEVRWRRAYGASLTESTRVALMTPMRSWPTITLYNPADTNAQVRDETSNSNCTSSVAANISDTAFDITCTNPSSGGAVGDFLGVHWVADARL